MSKYVILLIFNAFLSSISQVFLKKSALKEQDSFIFQYINIYVILGYTIFILVIIINIFLLRYLSIGIVNAFSESLPYVISIIFSHIFFNENINKFKIIASMLIIIGIILIVV